MSWLIEHTPFWAWAIAGVAIIAASWRLLGIRGAGAALVFLFTVLIWRDGRKDGRQSQATKDRTNADHAVRQADAARVDAIVRDADPERLRQSDGFRRD